MSRNTPTRLTRAAVSGLAIALMTVAFLRGNHLLGFEVGIVYVLVVAGVFWLLGESFSRKGVAAIIQMIVVAIAAYPIGFALAFPASINPDVQHFLNKHTTDRSVRRELRHVFDSDSAWGDLSVSTTHLKVVNVTIHGSLPTQDEMNRLRDTLIPACPTLKLCPLHWDIRLRDTNERVDGLDRALFPSTDKAAE